MAPLRWSDGASGRRAVLDGAWAWVARMPGFPRQGRTFAALMVVFGLAARLDFHRPALGADRPYLDRHPAGGWRRAGRNRTVGS